MGNDEALARLVESTGTSEPDPPTPPASAGVGTRDPELADMIAAAPLLEYVERDTGEQGHRSGGRVDFRNCPVCGHRGCFSVYPETNSWSCFSDSNATGIAGGTIIDYLMAVKGCGKSEAVTELRRLAGRPRERKTDGDATVEADDGGEDDGLPPIGRAMVKNPPKRAPVLIDGVLRKGHKLLVTAASKAGKTWLMIELAIAVATGGSWLGMRCERGRVLYVDFELDPPSFENRVRFVADAAGADLDAVESGVDVWHLRGRAPDMKKLVNGLSRRVSRGDYALAILDPLYKVYGGDENSAGDAREFWNQVDRIAASLDCAVACTHHHSKGAKGDASAIDRGSGSGVFGRDPDAPLDMIEIHPPEGEESPFAYGSRVFRVSDSGLREFPSMEPFDVVFEYPVHRVVENGETDGWRPRSSQSIAGKASGKSRKADAVKDVQRTEALICAEIARRGGEPLALSEAMELCGCKNTNTVKNRLAGSEILELVKPSRNRCDVALKAN